MIVCYDEDGRIYHTIFDPVQADIKDYYLNNEPCLSIENGPKGGTIADTFFVTNNALVARPVMPLLYDAVSFPVGETYRIDGIPKGAWVRFDGKEGACDDGVLDLTASEPGQYVLSIEKWPYLDAEVRVNVVPAQMETSN